VEHGRAIESRGQAIPFAQSVALLVHSDVHHSFEHPNLLVNHVRTNVNDLIPLSHWLAHSDSEIVAPNYGSIRVSHRAD
jgi:hypothetical protein